MKKLFFLLSITLFVGLQLKAQEADWTIYKEASFESHYTNTSCTDSLQWREGYIWNKCHNEWLVKEKFTGVPGNNTNSMFESADGSLLITDFYNGLTKFNGTNWTTFNLENSALSGYFNDVVETSNGHIYLGTSQKGLYRYDGTSWTIYNTENSSLPSNSINRIILNSDGSLYIATDEGLANFDGTDWVIYNKSNSPLLDNFVYSLFLNKDGLLYVGTFEGLNSFDGSDWAYLQILDGNTLIRKIYAVYETPSGQLYVGSDRGLAKHEEGLDWTMYKTNNSRLPDNTVGAIMQSSDSTLFIGTFDGLLIIKGTYWTAYDYENSSMISNHVYDFHETSDGKVYILTKGGFIEYNENEWKIYNDYNSGMYRGTVSNITFNQDNTITTNNGHYGYSVFDGTEWSRHHPGEHYTQNNIRDYIQTKTGDIYLATQGGLGKFNGSEWTFYTTENSELPNNNVWSLLESSTGAIYAGTSIGNLVKIDGDTWTIYNDSNSDMPRNTVQDLHEGSDGNIYIDAYISGLAIFDGESNWTTYRSYKSDLPDDNVLTFANAVNEDVYMGFKEDGLGIFNGTTWTMIDTTNSEIPSNTIYSVLETEDNILYIGTDKGLAIYNQTDWTILNTENSPLPSNNIIDIQVKDNILYFSTDKGLAVTKGGINIILNTDLNNKENILIAPNPLINQTTISFNSANNHSVDIISTKGKIVKSYRNIISPQLVIERSDFPSGLYIVKVSNDLGDIYTSKLLIQ